MVGISSAVAEDKLVEAKSTKNPDIQLNDIIKVLVDERPTVESRAVAAQKATSRFKKIAASVLAIEPNGDLRIEGRSKTLVGDEVLERTMTGKLRRQSLQADRSVRQDDVAEFRYRIRKKPMLHDAIAPDAIMPNPVRQVAAEMVESPKTAELRQKLVEMNRLQREIRELRAETGTAQQILVKVQMVEISMTKLRKMKTDFSTAEFRFVTRDSLDVLGNPTPRVDSKALIGFLDWLKENNIAKVLAQPTIITMDGRPASMQIGEEIPLPVGDMKAVEFKNVGVQLDVLPCALANNRVRLELKARISKRDDSRWLEVGNSRIPAIDVSQFDTAIETSFGQTVVLNGLTESRTEAQKTETGVKEVAIQVGLLLIVTPELVEQVSTAQRPEARAATK